MLHGQFRESHSKAKPITRVQETTGGYADAKSQNNRVGYSVSNNKTKPNSYLLLSEFETHLRDEFHRLSFSHSNLIEPTTPTSDMSKTVVVETSTQGYLAKQLRLEYPEKSSNVLTTKKDLTAANFGNDYSNYFIREGKLPQCWVRNIETPLDGYPKLQQLHDLKKTHFEKHASDPIGLRYSESKIPSVISEMCSNGVHFDVVVINGCAEKFSSEYLKTLKIDLLTPRPSLLYLWVPPTEIANGSKLMEMWGFRRGEDITFLVKSLDSKFASKINPWLKDKNVFMPSTWRCLMGLKGTLRRSNDTDLINCNIDTDVIIEKQNERPCIVPEQFYTIVENFTSMARKLHIVPFRASKHLPVRCRKGWVILSPDIFSVGKFHPDMYTRRSLIPINEKIDSLRPQTPTNNN